MEMHIGKQVLFWQFMFFPAFSSSLDTFANIGLLSRISHDSALYAPLVALW